MYTRAKIQQMLEMARQLRFWDDVAHWEAELERLDN